MDKTCCKCGVVKPLSEFYFRQPNARNKRGVYSSDCKACIKTYRTTRYRTDPDVKLRAKQYSTYWKRQNPEAEARRRARPENKATKRESAIKLRYGLGSAEYEALEAAQGGLCAICNQPERATRTHRLTVDHSHINGKIRGLLCSQCNRAIGLLGDSAAILRVAADYVEDRS